MGVVGVVVEVGGRGKGVEVGCAILVKQQINKRENKTNGFMRILVISIARGYK